MPPKIERITFRMATPDDKHLPTYDNTKLAALNTCPTWGILRYQMHKAMGSAGRAMPLECGSAMHEMFSWVRLCTLLRQLRAESLLAQHAYTYHGERLFGKLRFLEIGAQIPTSEDDYVQRCKIGAIAVLETSGYYDDPSDKRRTLTNMIECTLAYIDKWRWDDKVWIRDESDPTSDVGIEIPFDVVVHIDYKIDQEFDDGIGDAPLYGQADKVLEFRYTGKIDGIHWHNKTLTLGENKTSSRLGDAWATSFHMASQVTGYCIAASVFTERQVRNADVLGLAIPLPKSYDYGGVIVQPVSRADYHFEAWAKWALHTISIDQEYRGNPYDAPRYTHSCNRYFRACSMLPFCDSPREDQEQIIEDMTTEEWSPLHEKVGD